MDPISAAASVAKWIPQRLSERTAMGLENLAPTTSSVSLSSLIAQHRIGDDIAVKPVRFLEGTSVPIILSASVPLQIDEGWAGWAES